MSQIEELGHHILSGTLVLLLNLKNVESHVCLPIVSRWHARYLRPSCILVQGLVMMRVQGSVENLAATQPDVLFIVRTK